MSSITFTFTLLCTFNTFSRCLFYRSSISSLLCRGCPLSSKRMLIGAVLLVYGLTVLKKLLCQCHFMSSFSPFIETTIQLFLLFLFHCSSNCHAKVPGLVAPPLIFSHCEGHLRKALPLCLYDFNSVFCHPPALLPCLPCSSTDFFITRISATINTHICLCIHTHVSL